MSEPFDPVPEDLLVAYARDAQQRIDGSVGDPSMIVSAGALASLCAEVAVRRAVATPRLECTAGCERPICEKFEQQDDGEGRVDTYCARCGHTDECHQPVKTP